LIDIDTLSILTIFLTHARGIIVLSPNEQVVEISFTEPKK